MQGRLKMIYAQAIKELIFKQIYVPLREKVIKQSDARGRYS